MRICGKVWRQWHLCRHIFVKLLDFAGLDCVSVHFCPRKQPVMEGVFIALLFKLFAILKVIMDNWNILCKLKYTGGPRNSRWIRSRKRPRILNSHIKSPISLVNIGIGSNFSVKKSNIPTHNTFFQYYLLLWTKKNCRLYWKSHAKFN